jgi:magnesium transporter
LGENPAMPEAGELGIASAHATKAVPLARPDEAVEDVLKSLAGRDFESADDVVVLDGSSLVGLVPMAKLLAAPPGTPVARVMNADPPVVALGAHEEEVAWEMVRRGESSVAVLDAAGNFGGLVPPQGMVAILLAKHDEDVARLGGYLASTRRARQAAEETVARRLWHRLPWLLVGLVGAVASAAIIGAFEEELNDKVLLAFFIPGVVYMAAAIGTQTQAVLIRGLSVGVPLGTVFGRELASGVVLSFVVGAVLLPVALFGWGDADVAVAVAIALFASSVVSILIAIAIPWCLELLGSDPAFGSGPLATVLQDLVTIGIYFAVAITIAA